MKRLSSLFWISAFFLLLIGLSAVFAPWITQFSYEEQNIAERLQPPSERHWMGTDSLGRDLYSRIVYGARMSLAVGICTALFALVFGTLTGAASAWIGGRLDRWFATLLDLFYIFPLLLLAILLTLLFGRGFLGIFSALAVATWVTQARLVRALVWQAKEFPYTESARALGVRPARILWRHILPNLWGPIVVSLTLQIPANILAESFLSFIGLGLEPPYSSWGTLAAEGFRAIQGYPHLILYPGAVLFMTLLAFSWLGEGLRAALDPQSRISS